MNNMESFESAYKRLIHHEGGYSNHPHDRGGETYKGISRVHHPDWKGWEIIDMHKEEPTFPRYVDHDPDLQIQTEVFYKKLYWDTMYLDEVHPKVAYELFEIGVNMGVPRATLFAQRVCNAFNKRKKLWNDVKEDGVFGHKTLSAVTRMSSQYRGVHVFCKAMNCLQGCRYIELALNDSKMESFIWGWFNRIELFSST